MFSVQDFLETDILPWHRVLSGDSVLSGTPIEYISVIELPVGDFIRKNELVLTTALGCENNPGQMLRLVTDVRAAQASALLVAQQSDDIILPECVQEVLRESDFPLILIPWKPRFADITEAVLQKIRHNASAEIEFYEDVQKRLLSSYLSNCDAHDSAQVLSECFGGDAVIFDAYHRVKGVCKSLRQRERTALARLSDDLTRLIEIKANGRVYGSLYLSSKSGKVPFNEALYQRYLVMPLILWFDKEWVIESTRQNAKDDFIWKLAKSTPAEYPEMVEKGELLGFNLHYPYTCIVGQVHLGGARPAREVARWTTSNISSLKEEAIRMAGSLHRRIMITYQQKLIIIYLQNSESNTRQHVKEFLDKLEEKSASIFPQVRFSWGVSEILTETPNFSELFLNAKLAQELCAKDSGANTRFLFENTIIYKILSLLSADDVVNSHTRNIIQPLKAYDEANDSDLLKTLRVYLGAKNVSEAARILHLHRQSLLYRLNKIEELTGLSLKDADNLFLLEICVRLFT